MARPRSRLSLALLLAIAVVVLIYEFTPEQLDRPAEPEEASRLFPVFFIDELRTTQFDQRGELNYQFTAERAEHYQLDPKKMSTEDYTEIQTPYFIFYKAGALPWQLEAIKGVSYGEGERIELSEQVRAWQQLQTTATAEIQTEQLTLRPQRQFAQTDKPVMILYPRAQYDGDGMEADFQERTFTLLANVKGFHEPPTSP